MTTIAYRDGILAADGRLTSHNDTVLSDNAQKIHRLSNGELFALCGAEQFREPVLEALEDPDLGLPEAVDEGIGFTAILVGLDGSLRIYEGSGGWIPIHDDFVAFGTGADFAYGAMEAGANAEGAVEIAIRRDVYSGGTVVTMTPGIEEED